MSIKRRLGIKVSLATVFLLALAASTAHAQSAVHGTGTAGTIPVWINGFTIGNGVLTQSGGNVTNASGKLVGTQLVSTVPIGTPPLIVTSTTQVPNLKASFLGMFGPDGFIHNSTSVQAGATFNIAGNGTLGGTLNAGIVNVVGLYQIAGTPVLKVDATSFDVSVGNGAGFANITGARNTALGFQALESSVAGSDNTAVGYDALMNDNVSAGTGNSNTAVGSAALSSNDTGDNNTATGAAALASNVSGSNNVADGFDALEQNTLGTRNTAIGFQALRANTDGTDNVAVGYNALVDNTTTAGTTNGNQNTAIGNAALFANTTGNSNTATGFAALESATTGSNNTAMGDSAGDNVKDGHDNIMVGASAGNSFAGSESNNIDIGNLGVVGESGVIRIGTAGNQATTYVAGITGVTTGGAAVPVLVDANGQLGTMSSSRRYKEDIQDMGTASEGLLRLRPVTFRYKKAYDDGSKPIQYGLVAEEVAEVYPDLVVRGKDGQVETVQYYKLDAMLLNEIQKLAKAHTADQAEIAELKSQLADQLKQGQEQQAAMKQLLDQVRVIQTTLAAGSTPKAATLEVAAKY